MGLRELRALQAALATGAAALKPTRHPWLVLFSREGFEAILAALASAPGQRLLLYTLDNLSWH